LHAVALLAQKHAEQAINIFLELDINPAKVVALYPDEVAGRLAQPQEKWIELFGEKAPLGTASAALLKDVEVNTEPTEVTAVGDDEHKAPASNPPSFHEADSKSKAESRTSKTSNTLVSLLSDHLPTEEWRESVNNLLVYLSDQRRKISGALTAINIPSSQEAHATRLSEASVEEILSLPDAPPGALTPQQLFRFAQIVDTALFKSYLIVRPGLLGSLCRLDNWCEVSEVENELRARGVSLRFLSVVQYPSNMPCRNILS
jgi:Vam6/Vps39-like protein vacuolar protein sorting-associated protein 39